MQMRNDSISSQQVWIEVANVLERAFNDRLGDDGTDPTRPRMVLPDGRTAEEIRTSINWLRGQYESGAMTSLPTSLKDGNDRTTWEVNTVQLLNLVMKGTTEV